ncbi:MAG: nicotinate-nucleotide adenylyltransferase [Desulfobulbaceae bacterium]|nr:nicotinate-nucleotide adenylyltransferase [Desulfobulbaceae bacterium]
MHKLGVIHGRFQVLHNDHIRYLLEGKRRCSHLIIGITNPDPSLTKTDAADTLRSSEQSNPLTYYERYRLVRAAMGESGVPEEQFSIVPYPINLPNIYCYYVPMDAVFFLTIYDEWGERKMQMFQDLGLKVEVMWRRTPATKGLSAGDIRARMAQGEEWESFVPSVVAEILKELDIPGRIAACSSGKVE